MTLPPLAAGAPRDATAAPPEAAAAAPPPWSTPVAELSQRLGSSPRGLSPSDAARRLAAAPRPARPDASASLLGVLWQQLESPLLLLLVFAAAVSALTGEWIDA